MPSVKNEIANLLADPKNYRMQPHFSSKLRGKLKALALEHGFVMVRGKGFAQLPTKSEINSPPAVSSLIPPRTMPEAAHSQAQPILYGVKVSDLTPDPSSIWEKAKKINSQVQQHVEARQNQLIDFGGKPVAVAILSDQHIGGTGTNYQAMERDARIIANTDGFYAILTGDAINNFIVSKLVAARVADALRVDEQWLMLEHYIKFFTDEHGTNRILAAVSGNHEQWTHKIAGFDHLKNVLPKQILYDTDQLEVTLKVGAFSSKWMFRHKTKYNSVYNALHGVKQSLRLGSSDPDVICAAHIHRGAVFETFYHQDRKRLGILTGTYKTEDAYARQEGFGGGGQGNCVCVVITPDGKITPFDDAQSAANFLEMERMKARLT
jgi:hypothetical protein